MLDRVIGYDRHLNFGVGFFNGFELAKYCLDTLFVQLLLDLALDDVSLREEFTLLRNYFLLDTSPRTHILVPIVIRNFACFAVFVSDRHLDLAILAKECLYVLCLIRAILTPLRIKYYLLFYFFLHLHYSFIFHNHLVQNLTLLFVS